ncbi:hypothetical protein BASA81_017271 [Batrachochytrium salamandrivorans]|nr:hypothetical protein BASA81_017271 [Batrachochytrium salamandrivorans]
MWHVSTASVATLVTAATLFSTIGTGFGPMMVAHAQEGQGSAGTGTASNPFAGYSCDASVCKPPSCRCASPGTPVANPPQFVVVTYDDAVQAVQLTPTLLWYLVSFEFSAMTSKLSGHRLMPLIANRKNPNGCPGLATWFAQVYYSDPLLLTQWYAAGNEIADHTVTHTPPFAGSYAEIEGMRAWATRLAGIPRGKIQGVRFPFLNYTADALSMIQKMGFTYDSSMSAQDSDSFWPYTLDNGLLTTVVALLISAVKDSRLLGCGRCPFTA